MKPIAEGLHRLDKFPPFVRDLYLMGDVLIDAGAWWDGPCILRRLRGRAISTVALTHTHPDHQEASHEVFTALRHPCGAVKRTPTPSRAGG